MGTIEKVGAGRAGEEKLALANEGAAESRGLTPPDSMPQIKTRTL